MKLRDSRADLVVFAVAAVMLVPLLVHLARIVIDALSIPFE